MSKFVPMLVVVASSALLFGCGAAPKTPEAPMTSTDDEQDIDSLEAALVRDESQLQSLLSSTSGGGARPLPEESAPAEPDAPLALSTNRDDTPCGKACRALASMRRSAQGICRLAGQEHDRCHRANERVVSAEALVNDAGCSC